MTERIERLIPAGYSLKEFIAGYDRRNESKFKDLSFSEIRALIIKYNEIDPMIGAVLHKAYVVRNA